MRERKKDVFRQMLLEYEKLKSDKWDNYAGYDGWFSQQMNNARLISVSTYRKWIPAYAAIFREQGEDFPKFYKRIAELAEMEFQARQQLLKKYLDESGE